MSDRAEHTETTSDVAATLATATMDELLAAMESRCDAVVFAGQMSAGPAYRSRVCGNRILCLGLLEMVSCEVRENCLLTEGE